MVAAIKEFFPYLYGKAFTLLTDHNPLTSLRGLKDTGGKLKLTPLNTDLGRAMPMLMECHDEGQQQRRWRCLC